MAHGMAHTMASGLRIMSIACTPTRSLRLERDARSTLAPGMTHAVRVALSLESALGTVRTFLTSIVTTKKSVSGSLPFSGSGTFFLRCKPSQPAACTHRVRTQVDPDW